MGVEGRVRLSFWSTGTAALVRHHQSPRPVGRWKERRGSWDCEEGAGGASPALACLHRHQTGHYPCPPSSCHLKHLRWLAHLGSCKGVGRAGLCSLPPPSFADSLVIDMEEVSRADSGSSSAKEKLFVETVSVLFICPHVHFQL